MANFFSQSFFFLVYFQNFPHKNMSFVSGSHLSVLDVNENLPTTEIYYTKVASVKYYGGVALSVTSDADLSIVVEWSSDGLVFVPDLGRIIDYVGGSGPIFYERNVVGEYVKMTITNIGGTDEDIFTQVYAKIRATGNFDDGVNLDFPPQEDVWWYRDPTDPSETTHLKATNLPGNRPRNICACNLQQINQVDPALDYRHSTFLTGDSLVLNYDNKIGAFPRSSSFAGTVSFGSNPTTSLVGPGCLRNVLFNNKECTFTNTYPSPQQLSLRSNMLIANYEMDVWNVKDSHVENGYLSAIHQTNDVGQIVDSGGKNYYHGLWLATISNDLPGPGETGIYSNYNFISRLFNSLLYTEAMTLNYISGSLIYCSNIGPGTSMTGNCVLTDASNFLGTPAATGLDISGDDNTMITRFAGGYRFYTDSTSTTYAELPAGGDMWLPICDERLKQDLVAYTDSAGVLDRIATLPIYNYKSKALMTHDLEEEQNRFRISPTAQDFNAIFHPEDGDAAAVTVKCKGNAENCYRKKRTEEKTEKLEKDGEKDPQEELTPAQETTMEAEIDAELLTPDGIRITEKMSLMPLNLQEVTASLLLCIKELKIQLDDAVTRIAVLEAI